MEHRKLQEFTRKWFDEHESYWLETAHHEAFYMLENEYVHMEWSAFCRLLGSRYDYCCVSEQLIEAIQEEWESLEHES